MSQPDLASSPEHISSRRGRKILFASAGDSLIDFSNGASVATLDVLQGGSTDD